LREDYEERARGEETKRQRKALEQRIPTGFDLHWTSSSDQTKPNSYFKCQVSK